MSNFKFRETSLLEQLLGMKGGYVLTLVNRTFKEFFADENIDIYSDKYGFKGRRRPTTCAHSGRASRTM